MPASGYAHVCAGVPIENYLVVDEIEEIRGVFNPDGKKTGEIEVVQYKYTIFGKEMPIDYKDYPADYMGKVSRNRGWNMEKNFYHWLRMVGLSHADEELSVRCHHSPHDNHPVSHPKGVVGAVLKAYAATGHGERFVELSDRTISILIGKAATRLEKVGCTDAPKLYFYADCG